jgi:hypothetical protein
VPTSTTEPQLFAGADLIRCPACRQVTTIAERTDARWLPLVQATSRYSDLGRRPGVGWSEPFEIVCPACIMAARWAGGSWIGPAASALAEMLFKRRFGRPGEEVEP